MEVNTSLRGRLLKACAATALGPMVTVASQLVSVPALLTFWGTQKYGEWLILSSIPVYLSMSDLGFGSVAANEMAMQVAAGKKHDARETFHSLNALILGVSLLAFAIALIIIFATPLPMRLALKSLPAPQIRTSLVWFSLYAILTMQSSNLVGAFRCDGYF